MIFLKKLGKFLVNNILLFLIFFLLFSITIKQVVNKNVISKFVLNQVSENAVEVIDKNFDDISDEDLNKMKDRISNNEELNSMIEKYTANTIDSIATGKAGNINITDDVKNFVIENKSDIEKEYNITISDKDLNKAIDELDNKYDINNNYKKAVESASNSLSPEQKQVLRLYKFFISTKFIIIDIILIIIMIICIALYQKSFYKWLKNVSICGISSSIVVSILISLFVFLLNVASKSMDLNIIESLLIPIISLCIFIILLIIYVVINNKKVKY